MCGLVGFSKEKTGTINFDKLATLLYINSLTRGKDATGIYTDKLGIVKNACTANDFLIGLYKSDKTFIEDIKGSSLFIGHVRQSTHGAAKSDDNAHPFNYGSIIGAHNGVISNYETLLPKDCTKDKYPVDSMALFLRFSRDKNFKVLQEIQGAAAILFTDAENPNTLYVFRNEERPLYKGEVKGEGLYFSSTKESLETVGCSKIEEVKPNFVFQYTDGAFVKCFKITNKSIPFVKLYKTMYDLGREHGYGVLENFNLRYTYGTYYNNQHTTSVKIPKKGEYYRIAKVREGKKVTNTTASSFIDSLIDIKTDEKFYHSGTTLTDFDINSYNAFFKKDTIVATIKELRYTDRKTKDTAAVEGELFKIVTPLFRHGKDGESRQVAIKSMTDPKKNILWVSPVYLIALVDVDTYNIYAEKWGLVLPKEEIKEPEQVDDKTEDELADIVSQQIALKTGDSIPLTRVSNLPLTTPDVEKEIESFNANNLTIYEKLFHNLEYQESLFANLRDRLSPEEYDKLVPQGTREGIADLFSIVTQLYEQYTVMDNQNA